MSARSAARSSKDPAKASARAHRTPTHHRRVDHASQILELQRRAGNGAVGELLRTTGQRTRPAPTADAENVIRSPGQPLEPDFQARMEERLGQDLSDVRLHTDQEAARSADRLNANAYTVGRHIVFGAGQYRTETHGGQRLLAHELFHTLQQTSSATHAPPISPHGAAEAQADRASMAAINGGAVAAPMPTGVGVARQLRSLNARDLSEDELFEEINAVNSRLAEPESYPERDADEEYLGRLLAEQMRQTTQVPLSTVSPSTANPDQETNEAEGAQATEPEITSTAQIPRRRQPVAEDIIDMAANKGVKKSDIRAAISTMTDGHQINRLIKVLSDIDDKGEGLNEIGRFILAESLTQRELTTTFAAKILGGHETPRRKRPTPLPQPVFDPREEHPWFPEKDKVKSIEQHLRDDLPTLPAETIRQIASGEFPKDKAVRVARPGADDIFVVVHGSGFDLGVSTFREEPTDIETLKSQEGEFLGHHPGSEKSAKIASEVNVEFNARKRRLVEAGIPSGIAGGLLREEGEEQAKAAIGATATILGAGEGGLAALGGARQVSRTASVRSRQPTRRPSSGRSPLEGPGARQDIDRLSRQLESEGETGGFRADPGVEIPLRRSGSHPPTTAQPPAKVLEVSAGRKQTDTGLPTQRRLVETTRTDIRGTKPPRVSPRGLHKLDATKPIPKEFVGQFDTVLINNPRGFVKSKAAAQRILGELAKALKPGGKIIVQGRGAVSRRTRGINPDFQKFLDADPPPGLTKTVDPDQGGLPPPAPVGHGRRSRASDVPQEQILGGPFSSTSGKSLTSPSGRGGPNSRVIFVKARKTKK